MANYWFISKYASPPKYAKGPTRLFSIAKETIKLGNNVVILTSDSNHFSTYPDSKKTYNYYSEDNVPIIWIKTLKYKKNKSIKRLFSWIDFEIKLFLFSSKKIPKPEIVIISSLSIITVIFGYYLKKKYKSILVFEIRDIWPLTMIEEGGFSKWNPLVLLLGAIEKFGYKKADLIVGTMPKLDLHIKNTIGYNKPFFCSPIGFDPSKYNNSSTQNDLFDNLFPPEKFVVGYAGSMGISNGLESFINTIICMENDKSIHFMIAGSGDLKHKYEKLLINNSNVTFVGRIEQQNVQYFLAKCDILFLTTKRSNVWNFGQSMNKILEYMLASKPILATYSGYETMINEAKCGEFINSNDPIIIRKIILKYSKLSNEERILIGSYGRKWIYENRKYEKLTKEYLVAIHAIC